MTAPSTPLVVPSHGSAAVDAKPRLVDGGAECPTKRSGSEERLRVALDSGGLGIWEIDILLGALECSNRFKMHHGRMPGEPFACEDWALAVHPEDRERWIAALAEAIHSVGGFCLEYRTVWLDATVHWNRVNGVCACGANGEAASMSGVSIDLTDQRRREEAERAKLAKAGLDSERKTQFLALLGHELRNPLAPIRNGLQVLRFHGGDATERERVRAMVERHVSHMAHLINDLLDVARIERDEVQIELERFDARSALTMAIEACTPLVEAKRHAFKATGFDCPAIIMGDPARVAQMASNLLNNAVKYTPEGGTITIDLSVKDGRASICVGDNGVGLSPAELRKVFGMFEQVAAQKRRSEGGLGIGLALTRRLAELHGGSVSATSDGANRGCRFTLELPLDTSAPAAAPLADRPRSARGLRALVVDDRADAANSLAAVLEMLGHRASVAHDGVAALAAAEREWPDVAFIDLSMPGMDGDAVARALRASALRPVPVLIALTGHSRKTFGSQANDFDGVLTKPVGLDDLIWALEKSPRVQDAMIAPQVVGLDSLS